MIFRPLLFERAYLVLCSPRAGALPARPRAMPRGNLRGAERHARFTLRGELGAASEILRSLDYRPGKRWRLAPRRQSRRWECLAPPKSREQGRRPTHRCQRRQQRRPRCGPTNVFGVVLFSSFVRSPMLTGTAPYAGVCDARRARHVQDTARAAAAPRREALLVRAFEPANTMSPSSPFLFHPSAPLATSVVPVVKSVLKRVSGRV